MIHDGYVWHGSVFARRRGEWMLVDDTFMNGGNPLQLPEELTVWAAGLGAKRMRILIPREPRNVELNLPEDMASQERHGAVVHEMAEDDPDQVRVAMVRADRFRMGGDSGNILASVFAEENLADFRRQCAAKKIIFEGLGPLELGLLNYHARLSNHKRCLLLLPTGCFYAAPAAQGQPFTFVSAPLKFHPSDYETHPERYERLARRMQTHRGTPALVWSLESLSSEQEGIVKELFDGEEELLFSDLREQMVRMARHAAWGWETGTFFNGAAFVGMREEPRDPHLMGSWLFLLIVLGCAAGMGWLSLESHNRLLAARARQEAWEGLEKERERLKQEASALRQERDHRQQVTQTLRDTQILPDGLMEVFDVLRKKMPPYTRLTGLYQAPFLAMHEEENGTHKQQSPDDDVVVEEAETPVPCKLVIEGVTFSQQSLSDFGGILEQALQDSGLQVIPGRFERLERPNELTFEYHISPRPGSIR